LIPIGDALKFRLHASQIRTPRRNYAVVRRSILLVPFLILAIPLITCSQTLYRWVDEGGNRHFTTEYENVPPEYRVAGQKEKSTDKGNTIQQPPVTQRVEQAESGPREVMDEQSKWGDTPTSSRRRQEPGGSERERTPRVEFEGHYWIPDLEAEIRYTELDRGTTTDLKEDLGIKDENYPEVRFTWFIGPRHRVRLSYTQVTYSGENNIGRTIEFGGDTFTVGSLVESEFDLKYLKLGWVWELIHLADGAVKLGTLLEGKAFLLDASLDAPNLIPPIDESVDVSAGFPTAGVVLGIYPHRFINGFAEISGMYGGKYGYAFDGEAGVKITPIRNVSVFGGWRILDFKVEDEPDFAKVTISGPFAGAIWRF
jgi:hypothetical protein